MQTFHKLLLASSVTKENVYNIEKVTMNITTSVVRPSIDYHNDNIHGHFLYVVHILFSHWMDEMDVIDIWRLHHPLERKFTWLRYKPKLVMRRLDFFLVSYSLTELMGKSEIRPGFLSDHSNITINFNSNFYPRGPSY